MPGGDQTGPLGMGPMTGRAAGYCAGFGVPGFMNPVGGGFGRGFRGGGGFGWRNRYYATGIPGWMWGGSPGYEATAVPGISKDQETEALKAQVKYFEETLNNIKNRLNELESGSKTE